jgi:hypothetical protein
MCSCDPIQPVLFEEQVDGVLAQGLGRAFDLHRQHAQLLPSFRLQQDALALAAWRPLSGGLRGWLDHGVGRYGRGCGAE